MKIKTSELEGAALDWAVATALGYTRSTVTVINFGKRVKRFTPYPFYDEVEGDDPEFKPSIKWSQGGPIIERELIKVEPRFLSAGPARDEAVWVWQASCVPEDIEAFFLDGTTPLIAAMRCYVASKLGNEIEIPEELI